MIRPSLRCKCGYVFQIAAVEEQSEEIRATYRDILPKMLFACPGCSQLSPFNTESKKGGITGGKVIPNRDMQDLIRKLDEI